MDYYYNYINQRFIKKSPELENRLKLARNEKIRPSITRLRIHN